MGLAHSIHGYADKKANRRKKQACFTCMKVTGLVPELRSVSHNELTGFTNVSRSRSRSPASSSAKIASLYCFTVASLAFCQNAMARFCGAKQLPICQRSKSFILPHLNHVLREKLRFPVGASRLVSSWKSSRCNWGRQKERITKIQPN
jgi:hypothetical protein